MKNRPNSNYILSVMRDGDMDDPWGSAMAWAFACADILTVMGADVPVELEYRPSPFVKIEEPYSYVHESYEDQLVWEFLYAGKSDVSDIGLENRITQIQFAAKCLSRYIDWCATAGKDY